MFKNLFKKRKQETEKEFHGVGMNHVGYGGLIVKDIEGGPNPFPLPESNQAKHLISPDKLTEYRIDYKHYNKVIGYINKSLKEIANPDEKLHLSFKNDYKLDIFESQKLISEIKSSGYNFVLFWNGSQLYAIDLYV